MFVFTASNGLYSHAGTCFIAAAWKTTSVPRSTDTTELGVPDVADLELQASVALLLVDDLVGGHPAMLEVQSHLMLERLAAREDHHLVRQSDLALKEPSHDDLAEGPGPSGHHHSLTG